MFHFLLFFTSHASTRLFSLSIFLFKNLKIEGAQKSSKKNLLRITSIEKSLKNEPTIKKSFLNNGEFKEIFVLGSLQPQFIQVKNLVTTK